MVAITLIAFGQLAELLGDTQITMHALDTAGLQESLINHFPELKNRKYVIAVNKQVSSVNVLLTEGATVALLPPFSGG
jgi:molybdopterin synthase sulfur carrier subunit